MKRNDILFYISLICALWFAVTGIFWVYWGALIVAYPVGLVSFFIWRSIRHENKKRTKFIPAILLVGLALSLAFLIGLLLRN